MLDIIKLLPDSTANKIAAGEVVVRPAAVVKELLENAMDAEATEITLIIKEGGKSLIQIVDNGNGMSETDVRMAFERHATSKINDIDDLFTIQTLGFRGEALASIAAVSKVELKSCLPDHELGSVIQIEGAKLVKHETAQAASGTKITVQHLFYNVPARRKFLKSESVETRHIFNEFTRIALAHPEVKMSFFNNEKEVFRLPAENLRKRILHLFDKKYDERLVPVEEDTDIVKVEGFIGKPEYARKSKGEQFFFVNERFIKSPYLHHAVTGAYHDFIDEKQQPLYVLKLTIDPSRIDINVHPSKHEIKFQDERYIYQIVQAAVKHALAKYSVTPTLDFEADPTFNRHEYFSNPLEGSKVENPIVSRKSNTFLNRKVEQRQPVGDWQTFYREQELSREGHAVLNLGGDTIGDTEIHTTKLFQLNLKYIVVAKKNGFLLIDQRKAHQRILFEKFANTAEGEIYPSQKLLYPENFECPAADALVLTEHLEILQLLGFDIGAFGHNTFIIHAQPANVELKNLSAFLESIIDDLKEGSKKIGAKEVKDKVARRMAIHAAIPYGKQMGVTEMQSLVDQLFACTMPNYGLRKDLTFVALEEEQLNAMFRL